MYVPAMRCLLAILWFAACSHPRAPLKPVECLPLPVASPEPGPAPMTPPKAPALDDAAVIAKTQAFLAAVDRYDRAAFDPLVGPAYIFFETGRTYDLAIMHRSMQQQIEHHLPARTRVCDKQRVVRSDNSLLYVDRCKVTLAAHDDVPTLEHPEYDAILWTPHGTDWRVVYFAVESAGLDTEREGWNETYRSGVHFKTTANQHLIDSVKGRKPGTALDVAMGQGRNVLYLASQRWKVTGVDISDEGMKIAQVNAAKQKLKIETVNHDMNTYDFGTAKWDLITYIYAGNNPALIDQMKIGIKKGGLFVVEFFHKEATAGTGIGGFATGELAKELSDGWTILKDEVVEDIADWGLDKTKVVRFTAQKK